MTTISKNKNPSSVSSGKAAARLAEPQGWEGWAGQQKQGCTACRELPRMAFGADYTDSKIVP